MKACCRARLAGPAAGRVWGACWVAPVQQQQLPPPQACQAAASLRQPGPAPTWRLWQQARLGHVRSGAFAWPVYDLRGECVHPGPSYAQQVRRGSGGSGGVARCAVRAAQRARPAGWRQLSACSARRGLTSTCAHEPSWRSSGPEKRTCSERAPTELQLLLGRRPQRGGRPSG